MIWLLCIEHDLPFSFVEYKRVRELLKYLNPEAKIYSRRMVIVDVINIYDSEKKKLKQILSRIPSKVYLTSNVWTSCTIEGYIILTTHFVDENGSLTVKF